MRLARRAAKGEWREWDVDPTLATMRLSRRWGTRVSTRVGGGSKGYQMRQDLAGAMGAFGLQPKAGAKPGWLTMTPLTRNRSGEWGSCSTCERTASGRVFWHQF